MSKKETAETRAAKADEKDRALEAKREAKIMHKKAPAKKAAVVKAKAPKKVSATVSRKTKVATKVVGSPKKAKALVIEVAPTKVVRKAASVPRIASFPAPVIKAAPPNRARKAVASEAAKIGKQPTSSAAPTKTRSGTVRRFIEDMLWSGKKTDKEIHEAVLVHFPNNAQHAAVSWYRADMKRKGVVFPI